MTRRVQNPALIGGCVGFLEMKVDSQGAWALLEDIWNVKMQPDGGCLLGVIGCEIHPWFGSMVSLNT